MSLTNSVTEFSVSNVKFFASNDYVFRNNKSCVHLCLMAGCG